jgi:hypothetical protein
MILAALNAHTYNAIKFTRGMLTEFLIGVTGDVSEEDLDNFAQLLREATQGVNKAWQPPIIPLPADSTIEKIALKENEKDMGYETWMALLIAQICAVYRMDPSTINAKPWDGGSGPSLSAPNRQQEIALAKEEGLQSDWEHLNASFFTPIVQMVHPDLYVEMQTGDFDPLKEAQVGEIRSRSHVTRNERRLEDGLDPMGFWLDPDAYMAASPEDQRRHDENPWNLPADQSFVNLVTGKKIGAENPYGVPPTAGAVSPFAPPSLSGEAVRQRPTDPSALAGDGSDPAARDGFPAGRPVESGKRAPATELSAAVPQPANAPINTQPGPVERPVPQRDTAGSVSPPTMATAPDPREEPSGAKLPPSDAAAAAQLRERLAKAEATRITIRITTS